MTFIPGLVATHGSGHSSPKIVNEKPESRQPLRTNLDKMRYANRSALVRSGFECAPNHAVLLCEKYAYSSAVHQADNQPFKSDSELMRMLHGIFKEERKW